MDGRALYSELQTRGIAIPVIFYTAYPVFDDQAEGGDVVAYMSKAVDRADLYALLPPAIRMARSRQKSSSNASDGG
jgi:FixJ family two-component response regulator